jgi:hypothetical protein
MIDADVRAIVESAHLCFAATVTPDGKPNLSPKGTVRVLDDHHLFFLDIASPRTRANLEHSPWMEINVVDQLSRRGYRCFGRAMIHRGDDVFTKATSQVFAEEGMSYPVEAVVTLKVERLEPLWSPGYSHVPDEADMRAWWKSRRATLDADYDNYLDRR